MSNFHSVSFHPQRFGLLALLLACCAIANPLAAQKKMVLTSYNSEVTDAVITSVSPDINYGNEPHMWTYAWLQSGSLAIIRPLLRFDLSAVPANATVKEALLVLHYDPSTNPADGAHSGNTGFYIRRITEPWEELSVMWNNQPATTTENEVFVPSFGYDRQNYVVNVTNQVKNMLSAGGGNYGFMLQLLDEQPFNVARIAGAQHADPSRRPQLWLAIDDNATGTDEEKADAGVKYFHIGPNPTSGELFLSSDQIPTSTNTAELYNLEGQLVLQEKLAGSYSSLYLNQLPAATYLLKIRNDSGYFQQEEIILVK